ncbi:tetratricopeptide repeat protein [Mesorhizobium sp. UC22_110]
METIQFIDRSPGEDPLRSDDPTNFAFTLGSGATLGSVAIEVKNLKTGRILTSETLTAFETTASQVTDHVAKILGSVTGPFGSIYGYIEQNRLQNDLTTCVILSKSYPSNQSAEGHEAAYRCLENLVARGETSAMIYATLAGQQLDAIVWGYPYPPNPSVQQAMAYVNKAIQIDPSSSRAYRMAAYAEGVIGNQKERVRWAKKAYDAAPYDLRAVYHYGWALVMVADYREGTALLARSLNLANPHSKWLDYALFQGAFMLDDLELQKRAAQALSTVEPQPEYLVAQLIVATQDGNSDQMTRLLADLHSRFSGFCGKSTRHLRQESLSARYDGETAAGPSECRAEACNRHCGERSTAFTSDSGDAQFGRSADRVSLCKRNRRRHGACGCRTTCRSFPFRNHQFYRSRSRPGPQQGSGRDQFRFQRPARSFGRNGGRRDPEFAKRNRCLVPQFDGIRHHTSTSWPPGRENPG